MTTLAEVLDKIWRTPNRQMAWGRIPVGHVIGAKVEPPFAPNADYVVVRLGSMFLKDSRVLWLKLSPLVHATVGMNGRKALRNETAVIGPAQFGDLATASADRSIVLNQKLAGPAVWRSGDLAVAAGLFAVPKDQAAGQLLDTLAQLSGLGIPGLKESGQIASIVKSGVEGLIGLNGTKPMLGVKIALGDPLVATEGEKAAPCVLAGIAAPEADIKFENLWVRDGRLLQGASPAALSPFEAQDHLLVTIERGPPRQDWRGLPGLTPHENAFDAPLREAGLARSVVEQRINDAYVSFDADLTAEDELTEPDKDRIRGEVIAELKTRVARKYGAVFGAERRSVGGITRAVDPEGFNFLDVGDRGPEDTRVVKQGARPF